MLPFSCRLLYLPFTRKRPASSPGPPPPSPGRNRFILHFLDLSFRPQKHYISCSYYSPKKFTLFATKFKTDVKPHCWIFLFYFLLSYLPEETYFQQSGIFCRGRRYPLKSPKGLYPSPMRNTTNSTRLLRSRKGKKKKDKVGDGKDSSGRLSSAITRYRCWICTSKKHVDCTCKSQSSTHMLGEHWRLNMIKVQNLLLSY